MMRLNADDDAPLYVQLADKLRNQILDGVFAVNDPLPSESELVRQFDVSRATTREAISLLAEEGLLSKIQGKGSYVRALAVEQNFLGLLEFRRDLRRQGHVPTYEILSFSRALPSVSIREMFRLSDDDEVFNIQRLKRSDGQPIILERIYVPVRLVPDLSEDEIRVTWLNEVLASYGVQLWRGRKTVQPIFMGNAEAKILNVRPNSVGLLVDRTIWQTAEETEPVTFTRSIICGDAARFFIDTSVDQPDHH